MHGCEALLTEEVVAVEADVCSTQTDDGTEVEEETKRIEGGEEELDENEEEEEEKEV